MRICILAEQPAIDLPTLGSKKLFGSLTASVVNQRTRVINNFLKACQDEISITTSAEWEVFLRGQKPGAAPSSSNPLPPTPAELRSPGARMDAAPSATLGENPAAVQG